MEWQINQTTMESQPESDHRHILELRKHKEVSPNFARACLMCSVLGLQ